MPALIRFQWWRDNLEATAAGRAPQHPLLGTLARELAERHLGAPDLLALVNGHEQAFEAGPPADLSALLDAMRSTAGCLQRLWARNLGCTDDGWLARAEAAGTALGMTELARAWAFNPQPPSSHVLSTPTEREDTAPTPAMPDEAVRRHVIDQLLTSSDRLIVAAIAEAPPAAWLTAFLPARVARSTARSLRRLKVLPNPAAGRRSPFLPLALVYAWARGRP